MVVATLALGLTLVVVGLRLAIASREWFYADDFFFLNLVRSMRWNWLEAFAPMRARVIGAYRPLGLDAYFRLNFALFGWNAFGYYVTGLVLQMLTALGVVAIARRYGLSIFAALWAGLFVLLAGPSSTGTYEIADHNYICAAVSTTWAFVWFCDYASSGRALWRWLSCAMFVVALLCNEVAAVLPVLAFVALMLSSDGTRRARARKAALALIPHWIALCLFLDFRANGVPTHSTAKHMAAWFYEVDISLDMVKNSVGNLAYLTGGKLGLCAVLLIAVAALWPLARAPRKLATPAAQLASVCALWLGLTLLPFSVLALPAMRFALVLLPAAALLGGVLCDAVLARMPARWQAPALLCALALVPSWSEMLSKLDHPRGAVYRAAHAVIERAYAENPQSCITVVCNGPGLANAAQCADFREGAFLSQLWESVDPNRYMQLEFSEAGSAAFLEQVRNVDDCLRFYLKRDLTLSTTPLATSGTARLTQPPVPPPPSFM